MRRGASWLLIGAALALVTSCSDDDDGDAHRDQPSVGLDEIQVLAAHNAYHLEGEKALLDAITAQLPELTPTIE